MTNMVVTIGSEMGWGDDDVDGDDEEAALQDLRLAFQASDVDGNGWLDADEIDLLLSHKRLSSVSALLNKHYGQVPDRGPNFEEFLALYKTTWTLQEFWVEEVQLEILTDFAATAPASLEHSIVLEDKRSGHRILHRATSGVVSSPAASATMSTDLKDAWDILARGADRVSIKTIDALLGDTHHRALPADADGTIDFACFVTHFNDLWEEEEEEDDDDGDDQEEGGDAATEGGDGSAGGSGGGVAGIGEDHIGDAEIESAFGSGEPAVVSAAASQTASQTEAAVAESKGDASASGPSTAASLIESAATAAPDVSEKKMAVRLTIIGEVSERMRE